MQVDFAYVMKIKAIIDKHRQRAKLSGYRLPLVIYRHEECIDHYRHFLSLYIDPRILDLTKNTHYKANDIIGHEYEMVLFHLSKTFDPNLFAAASGTLKQGGLFVVFVTEKPSKQFYFNRYVISRIKRSRHFLSINPERNPEVKEPVTTTSHLITSNPFEQQNLAVSAIEKLVTKKNRGVISITADRGRGKSASIGIAIGRLIQKESLNLLITAPNAAATNIIFKHIQLTQPDINLKKQHVNYNTSTVNFIAPDKLITLQPEADLLIVDEASGFNMHTLTQLINSYPKIIFSTTLHGYEGSGQSFANRFYQMLDNTYPKFQSLKLTQPIRWNAGDPLEKFINKIFFLNEELPSIKTTEKLNHQNIEFLSTDNERLRLDDTLLKSVYLLLKGAHYKTSPNDLRQLLTSDNSEILIAKYKTFILAAAVLEKESLQNSNLVDQIYKGQRRPKGNLIPQSIISHLGLKQAANYRYLRIMRIAVHPDHQNNGIGSLLMEQIISSEKLAKTDFIGSSFGATPQLLRFWNKFGFRHLRVGYKKNVFSGNNAMLVTLPLNANAEKLQYEADNIFIDNLYAQLQATHNKLDPELVYEILSHFSSCNQQIDISQKAKDDVISFTRFNRSYDDNLASLKKFLFEIIAHSNAFKTLNKEQATLLILKVLQNRDMKEITQHLGMTGKKHVFKELKTSFENLLKYLR